MPRVAAFDLSLTGTGWCKCGPEGIMWGTITSKLTGFERFQLILNAVLKLAREADLVVMEDLAYGANMPGVTERAGLAYLVRYALWLRKQRYCLVSPLSLKKFVSGSGKTQKSGMILEVYKRFRDHEDKPISCADDNSADAVGLCFIGRALLGDWEPQNEAQREVLAKLKVKLCQPE